MLVETGGDKLTYINSRGSVAVVIQSPVNIGTSFNCMSKPFVDWLLDHHIDVAGVFPVIPHLGKYGLADLRKGWARVVQEIETFTPNVKRILLMCDTNMLGVAMPVIKKVADIQNTHGTVFSFGGYELIPTFEFHKTGTYYNDYINRDIERLNNYTKPSKPLDYNLDCKLYEIQDEVVIDLETTGLSCFDDTITSIGLRCNNQRFIYTQDIPHIIDIIIDKLNTGKITKIIGHNIQFDLGFLGQAFIKASYGKIVDTMLISKSRGELINSLKHLGNLYTNRPGCYAWIDDVFDYNDPRYLCEDLEVTYKLYRLWKDDIPFVTHIVFKAASMAASQTLLGTRVDVAKLETVEQEGKILVQQLRDELIEKYGVDPNKQEELITVLESRGYQFSKRTKSGELALDSKVLEEHGLEDILEYRKAQKLDSSFVGKIKSLMRGDILPHRQIMFGAETGRSTMTDYNHQQSGRKGPVRSLTISRFEDGSIGTVDFSQAELRCAAYISQDYMMAEALMQSDMHRSNAARANKIPIEQVTDDQRYEAKTTVFGCVYGQMPKTEGQKLVFEYLKSEFYDLFNWIEYTRKKTMRELEVTDAWGKTRDLRDILERRGKYGVARAGVNTPIQGLASHMAIWVTVRCWELLNQYTKSLVVFGVHDSIVFDIYPGDEQKVVELVAQAFKELGMLIKQQFKIAHILSMQGEFQIGKNLADTKNGEKVMVSTL